MDDCFARIIDGLPVILCQSQFREMSLARFFKCDLDLLQLMVSNVSCLQGCLFCTTRSSIPMACHLES